MPTIRLLFCRTLSWKEPVSLLSTPILRFVAWSPWSHEAVVMEDGASVVDATFSHGGVRLRPLADVLAVSSQYKFRDIEVPDPAAGYAFARSQIGKPYDWSGALGLGLHRDWQTEDAWWCSELSEAVLAAAGRCRFVNNPRRVTQQHSWMVA